MRSALHKLVAQEDINFLLTNRLPRRLTTRFVGWFSKIQNPVVRKTSIAAWKLFSDLDRSKPRRPVQVDHDVFIAAEPCARPIVQTRDHVLAVRPIVARSLIRGGPALSGKAPLHLVNCSAGC